MSLGTNHPALGLRGRKILIVTDDDSKVENLSEILGPEGYQISQIKSSEAAIDHFPQGDPDLILLDAHLPGADPFELCRTIRRQRGSECAPIILIASHGDPDNAVEGLAAGGVDYLSQPFRKQEVVARVRVHLLNRLRLAQLNRKDKAKTRLLSTAAHDLRNPLVSIRALTNLVRNGTVGPVTPEQRDLLDTVYDVSQSMLDLVNELLEVSVLDSGQMGLNLIPTSLAEVIGASVKLNNATAERKRSRIVWKPRPLPITLPLDKPKIRQVLNNLLDNAIKFSPPGSTISVETELSANQCTIAIRDQGPGVPEGERAQLFKDFSRTSVKPTGGESSTGLGLSICHRIMVAHAGGIHAENLPEGGAEFRITFPVAS